MICSYNKLLHGMPSLLHLSSTQSELGNCNVHYSGFYSDLSTPAAVDDEINTHDDSDRPCHWKNPFSEKYHCLPPDIAFQVHLLSQMDEHRGNDLNMFNEVIQCVKAQFGSLSCEPFICALSFLNKDCCNDDSNYMVLGYIPNLGYGEGKAKKQAAGMKLQDEHNCL